MTSFVRAHRPRRCQVNTYEFIDFAEPFLAAGEDVLHIAFSSGLSGTYESCARGAEELRAKYPDRKIVVVDSLAASMGEGLLVYYADENRKAGMSLDDNAKWLEENKLHLCHWFTVDDLMHLHRGGRVSKTSAVFGSLLGIKPVLHVDDEGHLILMSKVRGRDASLKALVGKMKETALSNVRDQMVFISHGDAQRGRGENRPVRQGPARGAEGHDSQYRHGDRKSFRPRYHRAVFHGNPSVTRQNTRCQVQNGRLL